MNNRFIKMFWHSDRGNVKNRLGGGGGFGPGKFSKTISNDINHEEVCNKHAIASLIETHTDEMKINFIALRFRWILKKSRK